MSVCVDESVFILMKVLFNTNIIINTNTFTHINTNTQSSTNINTHQHTHPSTNIVCWWVCLCVLFMSVFMTSMLMYYWVLYVCWWVCVICVCLLCVCWSCIHQHTISTHINTWLTHHTYRYTNINDLMHLVVGVKHKYLFLVNVCVYFVCDQHTFYTHTNTHINPHNQTHINTTLTYQYECEQLTYLF